jgi:hypothetical protein
LIGVVIMFDAGEFGAWPSAGSLRLVVFAKDTCTRRGRRLDAVPSAEV